MKFKMLYTVVLFLSVLSTRAQGPSARSVEERVQIMHAKFDSAFKPGADKLIKIDSVFAVFYQQQQKLRQELREKGDRPGFQIMREKMEPLRDARDKELKALLLSDQYKKWKDEIEPSMMPRRREE